MAMNDMLSLLRIAYYGLMAGTFAFLLLWEDGAPLVRGMPSRRRHVLRNLALFVCVVAVADGLVGAWLLDIPSRLTITPPGLLTPLPLIVQLIVAFVVMDLSTYAVHRLFHAQRWLWLMHSVHHSDAQVDVSTSIRHHPVEVAIDVAVKLGLYLLLGLPLWIEAARTLLINPLSMAQHANIAYPAWVERPLRWLLVTPGDASRASPAGSAGDQFQLRTMLLVLGPDLRHLPGSGSGATAPLWARQPRRRVLSVDCGHAADPRPGTALAYAVAVASGSGPRLPAAARSEARQSAIMTLS